MVPVGKRACVGGKVKEAASLLVDDADVEKTLSHRDARLVRPLQCEMGECVR